MRRPTLGVGGLFCLVDEPIFLHARLRLQRRKRSDLERDRTAVTIIGIRRMNVRFLPVGEPSCSAKATAVALRRRTSHQMLEFITINEIKSGYLHSEQPSAQFRHYDNRRNSGWSGIAQMVGDGISLFVRDRRRPRRQHIDVPCRKRSGRPDIFQASCNGETRGSTVDGSLLAEENRQFDAGLSSPSDLPGSAIALEVSS